MIVIRLSKKNKIQKFFYINVIYRKNSVFGKIIKRIGFYNPYINYGNKFYVNYNLLYNYVKKGAKISKRVYEILKL
ncbi:30S ribosomal protein S16, partial [Candidatus Carsonella ruddii]|nr:30S ribosomal protein S16 [Candidatus Carsonella ruddii]